MDVGVCGCGLGVSFESLFSIWPGSHWVTSALCYGAVKYLLLLSLLLLHCGETATLLSTLTNTVYLVDFPVLKQPLMIFQPHPSKSNTVIQVCCQYLIGLLLNQDGRYGNVYCTLSLASPAISLLCLLAWHAGLINIGLISRTARWPLIIPVILLALHCGNPVELINNSAKGRLQIETRQQSGEKSNCSHIINPH